MPKTLMVMTESVTQYGSSQPLPSLTISLSSSTNDDIHNSKQQVYGIISQLSTSDIIYEPAWMDCIVHTVSHSPFSKISH